MPFPYPESRADLAPFNIKSEGMEKEEWARKIPKVTESLYGAVLEMGGKITAEHGIVLNRKPFPTHDFYETQIGLCEMNQEGF